mgnify:CR=1 FL=1
MPLDTIPKSPPVPEPVTCGVLREVVKVGEVRRTTPPVPVDGSLEPVPPLEVGIAEPDRLKERVPVEVMGPPLIVRKGAAEVLVLIEVTVPEPGGAGDCQERSVPLDVRTVPLAPTLTRPVPPTEVGRAEPDRPIERVPLVVMGPPPTAKKESGEAMLTEVTVPDPGVDGA